MSDKPPFDPTKPFQAAAKPPFDPNKPFETASELSTGLGFGDFVDSLKVGVKDAANKYDKYLKAPVRSGLMALAKGEGIRKAGGDFIDQFSKDPSTAPNPMSISVEAGLPDKPLDPLYQRAAINAVLPISGAFIQTLAPELDKKLMNTTPADVGAFGVDLGADLTNVLPISGAFKGITKGGRLALKSGLGLIPKGIEAVSTAAKEVDTVADAIKAAKEVFSKGALVENAPVVEKAIQEVSGLKDIPKYLLTKDKEVQRLADTLIQSPTIGGSQTRKEVAPIFEGFQKFGKEVNAKASPLSQYEAGSQAASGIKDAFKRSLEPATEVYDALEGKFAKAPLDKLSFKRGLNQLRKQYAKTDFTGNAGNLIDNIEKTVLGVKDATTGKTVGGLSNIQELRNFRTNASNMLSGSASNTERNILDEIVQIATRERDRSTLKYAVNTGPKATRAERARAMVSEIRGADKVYSEGVQGAANALGVKSTSKQSTYRSILDKLEKTSPEKLAEQLFNRADINQLKSFQKTFPEQFDVLRSQHLGDIVQKSTIKGEFSAQRFVSQIDKLEPEVRNMILGDLQGKTASVQQVLNVLPPNLNPSGTAIRSEYLEAIFSPKKAAESIAQRQLLKGKSPKLPEAAVAPEIVEDSFLGALKRRASRPVRPITPQDLFKQRPSDIGAKGAQSLYGQSGRAKDIANRDKKERK